MDMIMVTAMDMGTTAQAPPRRVLLGAAGAIARERG
jgi:hypothetical protein